MTRPDGTQVELRVYTCRVCGNRFNDELRSRCGAPAPRNGRRGDNTAVVPVMQATANKVANEFGQLVEQPGALEAALDKLRKKYQKE